MLSVNGSLCIASPTPSPLSAVQRCWRSVSSRDPRETSMCLRSSRTTSSYQRNRSLPPCSTPPTGVARTIHRRATSASSSRFSPTSESTVEISSTSRRLSDQLVAFAWDEWAQMGLFATPHRRSTWAQDPEALFVFTLEVARADARLFDELMDWMLVNESLLSVRRLRAMCVDETDRALVATALGWLAHQRPRTRPGNRESTSDTTTLQPLFHSGGPVSKIDKDFAAAGWKRPSLIPSHKS